MLVLAMRKTPTGGEWRMLLNIKAKVNDQISREMMFLFIFRSFEYGELLQELNCIVVTSGQVLVDGQAVKACKIDLSCSASEV